MPMRSGSVNGDRSMTPSITLNMAAFAPVPSAIISRATVVNPGVRAIPRRASRTSSTNASA
jgi:hypothetical protein